MTFSFKNNISNRLRFLKKSARFIIYFKQHTFGPCHVCGQKSFFFADKPNLKESLYCFHCGSWSRIRYLAKQVAGTYGNGHSLPLAALVRDPGFLKMNIYEASARGGIHDLLKQCPGYVCSEYFDGQESGSRVNGIQCENLENLSFRDETFDLLVHTSVLEHVRKPLRALRENHRVLKPGGHLIFEIPITDPGQPVMRKNTIARVNTASGADEHILEPVFHGDPLGRAGGALVYTDFGLDIIETLKKTGFRRVIPKTRYLENSQMSHMAVFVCRK